MIIMLSPCNNATSQKTVWHRPHNCDIIPLAKLQVCSRVRPSAVFPSVCLSVCLPLCLPVCLSVGRFCISMVWQCHQLIDGTVELQRAWSVLMYVRALSSFLSVSLSILYNHHVVSL